MTEKTVKIKIRTNTKRCKGCMFCIDVCPQNVLEVSGKINKRGIRYVVLKHPEKCTGCGLCMLVCPDCAIEIVDEK
jgi:2-oxoglutarate ferredoxin oxidoreductase subunit delta